MATQTHPLEKTAPTPTSTGANGHGAVLGMDAKQLANGLGWFSIGLGVAELLAPRAIARMAGTKDHRALIRGYGLREIASGISILERPQNAGMVWSRVVGDAVDLVSLGTSLRSRRTDRTKAIGTMAAVAGVTVLDVLCAQQLSRIGKPELQIASTVIVDRPVQECYQYWRQLDHLPQFMDYIQSVRITGDKRSHWTAMLPGEKKMEWDAETTEDRPNERISWQSLPGSDVHHSGTVHFEAAPEGRGTMVRVNFDYSHPAKSAAVFAKLIGKHPEQVLYKDLRRFKQLMETGEVITTEGQSAGRNEGATWLDSIAQ